MAVCVEGGGRAERVGREFQRSYFDGTSVVNGFVDDDDDFPRFPCQLGCQGLVVVDARGRFATLRSPAYLEHREAAYDAVERMLEPLIAAAETRRRAAKAPRLDVDVDMDPPGTPERNLAPGEASSASDASASASATDATRASPSSPDATSTAPPRQVARFSKHACKGDAHALDDDDDDATASFEIPAVGVDVVDDEHDELHALLKTALATRSPRDVLSLGSAFATHATHEEALMRASGFADGEGAFSAAASHAKDHDRLVASATTAATTLEEDGKVAAAAIRHLGRSIIEHAVTFDASYAAFVAEKRRREETARTG